MGEAHKIGDTPGSSSLSDGNPARSFNIMQMWQEDTISTRALFSESRNAGKKIEAGASSFVDEIAQGKYSDAEIARKFTDLGKQLKGQDPMAVKFALDSAFQEKGMNWHARLDGDTVGIYRNQAEYDRKLLVKTNFFKPGEDMDAAFNPDKGALAKIAGDFAKGNPDKLSADALTTEVQKTIDKMKAAGAGPSDAKNALNTALQESGQGLDVSINTQGKVKVGPYHHNPLVAEINLSK